LFRLPFRGSLLADTGKQTVQRLLADLRFGEIRGSKPSRLGRLTVSYHTTQQLHITIRQSLHRLTTIQPLAVQPRHLQTAFADRGNHIQTMATGRASTLRGPHGLGRYPKHSRLLHHLIEMTMVVETHSRTRQITQTRLKCLPSQVPQHSITHSTT